MSTSKKIVLKSLDGGIFEVEEAVAVHSQIIAHMVEDDCFGNGIPLANVIGLILPKVIEYCKKHVVVPAGDGASSSYSEEELKKWDAESMSNFDKSTLFQLIEAANYLNNKDLLARTFQTAADMITRKTPQEICDFFNIENDFIPEEEEKMRKEN